MRVNLKDYNKGEFIRIIREWTGLTQKEFGELIDKKERTIQDYEANLVNYGVDVFEKIIEKTNINLIAEKRD